MTKNEIELFLTKYDFKRMELYSRKHKRTQQMFLVAKSAAEDILDILNAMR